MKSRHARTHTHAEDIRKRVVEWRRIVIVPARHRWQYTKTSEYTVNRQHVTLAC